mgnify:CR=1 FL=1
MKRTFLLLALCLTLAAAAAPAYRLQARGGAVCVYDPWLGWQPTGCPVSTLPPQAQRELARGLVFPTRAALSSAMEAYCS